MDPLQVVMIAAICVLSGAALVFGWWLWRKDRWEAQTSERIDAVAQALNGCQLRCANKTAEYVPRTDFEGRMLRMEDMVIRIHERVDWIAAKLAGNEETGRHE